MKRIIIYHFHSKQVFHWNLCDSKFPQVFGTILSILANFNCTVVWIVSVLPLRFSSPTLFSRPLGTVPTAPTTIGITITFMFHSFSSSLARSRYLSIFSPSFTFTLLSAGITKSTRWQGPFFFLVNTRSRLLAWIEWSVCTPKSQGISCIFKNSSSLYTICQYGQILTFCKIFSESAFPPSCALSCNLLVLICYILLCD